MVECAEIILALFNGEKGGTFNCVKYAQKRNKLVYNVWDKWLEYKKSNGV